METKKKKARIIWNIVISSCGFLLLFTAFNSIQNLQSSINSDEGLGLASLCVVYTALLMSSMFLPPYVLSRLGYKWTMVISMGCYVIYTAANYYSRWWSLIPSSGLLGLSAALLWSANGSYISTSATIYAQLSGETKESVVARFYGIFYFIFSSTQIWGNLISSLCFEKEMLAKEVFTADADKVCGAKFFRMPPSLQNETVPLFKPSPDNIVTMLSIYLGMGLLALLCVALLLRRLPQQDTGTRHVGTGSNLRLFTATLRLGKNLRAQLIIPMSCYWGLFHGFTYGDFTVAFITCTVGVHSVGVVMTSFGAASSISGLICGRLIKHTGRLPVSVVGCLVHFAVLIALLLWKPHEEFTWIIYILAAALGLCNGLLSTLVNVLYACYFPSEQEAAFSFLRLWESLGYVVSFSYSRFLAVNVKLYILLALNTLSLVGYFIAERLQKRMDRIPVEKLEEKQEEPLGVVLLYETGL